MRGSADMGYMCARCRKPLRWEDCQGESGLYSPNRTFTLCEPCFLQEDAEIDAKGMNDIPNRIEEYRQNMRLGPIGMSRWEAIRRAS